MTAAEALALVRQLLTDGLEPRPRSQGYARDLSAHVGDLQATMRAAVTIIDAATPAENGEGGDES